MTVAPPTQEQDLEAPIVDGLDRGVDRSEDHAVRQLLLDEPIEPLPSEEAEPEAPGPRTTRLRSAGIAGPIGFVLAILLAGLSWMIAADRTPVVESEGAVAVVAPSSAEAASGLLFLSTVAWGSDAETVGTFRHLVLDHGGAIEPAPGDVIEAVVIPADRLGRFVERLDESDAGGLRIAIDGREAPMLSGGGDWEDWSRRLQLRRAIRRAERAAEPVRLEIRSGD